MHVLPSIFLLNSINNSLKHFWLNTYRCQRHDVRPETIHRRAVLNEGERHLLNFFRKGQSTKVCEVRRGLGPHIDGVC